jgi:hypothetical protein
MFLLKKLAAWPTTSFSVTDWLKAEPESEFHSGSTASPAMKFVVVKTASGRWCWELTGADGHVHGRSTGDFVRMEQAAASAQVVQWVAAEASLVDQSGRRIPEI